MGAAHLISLGAVRFTPTGSQITELTVLVNRRRQNDAGGVGR
jgi:hypothetical protein